MIFPMQENDTSDAMPDIVQAAYAGDVKLVDELLKSGISPNTVDPRDNLSLLHIACLQGDEKLAELLIKRSEECNDVDFTIRSSFRPRLAWQYAVNGNHFDLGERVHRASLAPSARYSVLSPE